jgi:NADP-dependent 3-hydroxy acid dehydrogenase YdfG
MIDLNARVAWVQGGAGAVGLAVAHSLIDAGATVVLSARDEDKLKTALSTFKPDNKVFGSIVDITNRSSVFESANDIVRRHGKIDFLINSAGVNPSQRHWHELSEKDWLETVDVNLSGMFFTCQAVMQDMRPRKSGCIVNIASWAGKFAAFFAGPAYASTKRAVLALTETINMEECVNGIRATSISPAGIDTPLLDKRPVPPSAEIRATLLRPSDVADMVRYVLSLPNHVCINEILMSPTLNLPYLGELQTAKRPLSPQLKS